MSSRPTRAAKSTSSHFLASLHALTRSPSQPKDLKVRTSSRRAVRAKERTSNINNRRSGSATKKSNRVSRSRTRTPSTHRVRLFSFPFRRRKKADFSPSTVAEPKKSKKNKSKKTMKDSGALAHFVDMPLDIFAEVSDFPPFPPLSAAVHRRLSPPD